MLIRSVKSLARWAMVAFAAFGLAFACWKAQEHATVHSRSSETTELKPAAVPSRVVGIGIVEPPGRSTVIGFPQAGIVAKVHTTIDGQVCTGQALIQLDDRAANAEVRNRLADWELACRKLDRLKSLPRPEPIAVATQKVENARNSKRNALDQLERIRKIKESNMISEEEFRTREFADIKAGIEVIQAEAELSQALVGATPQELAIAKAEVEVAAVALERARTQLELLTIRSPIDARVLRCDVRVGEMVEASAKRDDAAIHLAALGNMHVRAEFDEEESSRVPPQAMAYGMVRGRIKNRLALRPIRVEPILTSKRNLLGHGTERVDTRVLQVLYEVVDSERTIRPGQAIDVFIEESSIDSSLNVPDHKPSGKIEDELQQDTLYLGPD